MAQISLGPIAIPATSTFAPVGSFTPASSTLALIQGNVSGGGSDSLTDLLLQIGPGNSGSLQNYVSGSDWGTPSQLIPFVSAGLSGIGGSPIATGAVFWCLVQLPGACAVAIQGKSAAGCNLAITVAFN